MSLRARRAKVLINEFQGDEKVGERKGRRLTVMVGVDRYVGLVPMSGHDFALFNDSPRSDPLTRTLHVKDEPTTLPRPIHHLREDVNSERRGHK